MRFICCFLLFQNLLLGFVIARSGTGVESFDVPIMSRNIRQVRRDVSSSIGLGDLDDMIYTVPIELGKGVFPFDLDTGSSDLWVVSDRCQNNTCHGQNVPRYPRSSLVPTGADIHIRYGDSFTGTYASGTIGMDTGSIAGISMIQQYFGLINDTTNNVVQFGISGIFGLGFPSESHVQKASVEARTGSIDETDDFINLSSTSGPLLSRMSMTGALEEPMFSISLQRDMIDPSGQGLLSIGKLPDGIDNATLTWVPVRLYTASEGGVYPLRWEIDLDGVFLDGKQLPSSTIPANGVNSTRVSALLDTGNSIIRGPKDLINSILSTVSQSYDPNAKRPVALLPCNAPHTLAFKIGGKMFPIDSRDFVSQVEPGNAVECQTGILTATDPPGVGTLFRWSLGTPFFRSNLVVFHYGNLTHPSADPPRVGIVSKVPANADQLLTNAVNSALSNHGNFLSTLDPAPTSEAVAEAKITVSFGSSDSSKPTTSTAATSTTSTTVLTTTTISVSVPSSAKSANAATSSYSGGCLRFLVITLFVFWFCFHRNILM